MILFIDDEPRLMELYVEAVRDAGLEARLLASVSEVNRFLQASECAPACIVLDIMFPADDNLPSSLTAKGLTAGMPLFACLRSVFPDAPVVVLTSSMSIAVKQFFQDQANCSFHYKSELLPRELAQVVVGVVEDNAERLIGELRCCPPGKRDARQFESLCVRILEYLFVPPLQRVVPQSRRSDAHDIRDAVIPNNASGYLWDSLRRDLDAKHIVVEFKNHARPVGKAEVVQLREYLARKTMGRFGLLVSRLAPSASALTARRDAYSDQNCLILLLDDGDLEEMIRIRRGGGDPSAVLQRMKEEFEIAY